MNITEQLTRKIGPLPVWGWGAMGAAGILILRQWQRTQQPEPTEDLGMGVGMGGGYGTAVALPGSDPITGQPAYGENLYLSFPWGEGYISVEGSGSQVAGILGQIPLAPITQQPQQILQPAPSPYDYYYPPPTQPAPSPITYPAPQPAPSGCYCGTTAIGRYSYYGSLSDCQAWASGCAPCACL